jgi:uncharacterized OB-fold protein
MIGENGAELFPGKTPGPTQQFLLHIEQGRFMLQKCTRTHQYFYYPRAATLQASSSELEWVEVSGDGTVYSTTVVRRPQERGGDYNISIVELSEGPRMLTRVLGIDPASVSIGMKVKAKIEKPDWDSKITTPLVVFYPA